MNLEKVFFGIEIIKTNVDFSLDVEGITEDSRRVRSSFVFCALKGERVDGNKYISSALSSGAVCILTDSCEDESVPYVLVKDARLVFSKILANFYSHPEKSFKIRVGVTGTNGKTSTTVMLKSIYESAGYKVGLIGTMKYLIGNKEYNSESDGNLLTTPDPENFWALLDVMRKEGVEVLVMECSSHALAMDKLGDIEFDCGVFTNLTRDHLNFHKTFDSYRDAKAKLFKMSKISLINDDDPAADALKESVSGELRTYSINNINSDFNAKNVRYNGADGIDYVFLEKDLIFRVFVGIPGKFTVYNSLAAASCAILTGVSPEMVVAGLQSVERVDGRIDRVALDAQFSVIIDFAHTPDAMENVLSTVKGFSEKRIITLFGCGGDRDRTKRPIMGRIACENSDVVIVTQDNSRTEDPEIIMDEIMEGVTKRDAVLRISDRTEAIRRAMDIAEKGDIVLLLGKGHEEYEIDKNGKRPYSERNEVLKYFEIMKSEGRA